MHRLVVAAVLALAALGLAACASGPARIPHTAAEQEMATVAGMPADIRFWADAAPQEYAGALTGLRRLLRGQETPALLALSGGGDYGAYGAGFMNGWTVTGTRPEFTVVTGVSTGALIAPYAFLGPEYDPVLRDIFTEIDAADVFDFRGLAGLFGTGLASNAPLAAMIARHVTPDLLERIAAEHERGRHLLVATTNLDAQRTVVWNMGRIAEIGTPRALEVFRRVLLASTSIPAIFPPTLIEVEANGTTFEELHVDGGATTQIFTLPEFVLLGLQDPLAPRGAEIYLLVNNTLEPSFELVRASTIPVATRSFSTIIKSSAQQSVVETFAFARNNDVDYHLTFIGPDFDKPYEGPFNRKFMNELFEYGLQRGRGPAFLDRPPVGD